MVCQRLLSTWMATNSIWRGWSWMELPFTSVLRTSIKKSSNAQFSPSAETKSLFNKSLYFNLFHAVIYKWSNNGWHLLSFWRNREWYTWFSSYTSTITPLPEDLLMSNFDNTTPIVLPLTYPGKKSWFVKCSLPTVFLLQLFFQPSPSNFNELIIKA